MAYTFSLQRQTSLPQAVTTLELAQAHSTGYGRPWKAEELLATLEQRGALWTMSAQTVSAKSGTHVVGQPSANSGEGQRAQPLAGFLLIGPEGDGWFIARLAVAEAYRRQGCGRELLAAGKQFCFPAPLFLEVSEKNTAALSLYHAFGFSEIRRRRAYYRDGADAIIMQLGSLPQS